jgi:hypothetical protein
VTLFMTPSNRHPTYLTLIPPNTPHPHIHHHTRHLFKIISVNEMFLIFLFLFTSNLTLMNHKIILIKILFQYNDHQILLRKYLYSTYPICPVARAFIVDLKIKTKDKCAGMHISVLQAGRVPRLTRSIGPG